MPSAKRPARHRFDEKHTAPAHISAAWAASRKTISKLGGIICGCCVPIHPVIDGRLFVSLLAHVRIVGAPATCLLLYIYAGMDVRLRPALGSDTTLVDQMRPALRWRYRCLKFPSCEANEGNEFRDRADEKLSVVETSAGAVRTSSPQEPRPKPRVQLSEQIHLGGIGRLDIERRYSRCRGLLGRRLGMPVEEFLQLSEIFL